MKKKIGDWDYCGSGALRRLFLSVRGFLRNGSVYMDGYSVSGDGREITLDIGVAASRGYIRKAAVSQQYGGKLYIDCYSAFGGINGRIGAKKQVYAAAGCGYDHHWDLSERELLSGNPAQGCGRQLAADEGKRTKIINANRLSRKVRPDKKPCILKC